MNLIEKYQSEFLSNFANYLIEYKKFLSFKSISTDKEYKKDCLECAEWLKAKLTNIGLKVEIHETGGLPLVFAEYIQAPNLKTVMYYGHYDVQPVDPIELWESDPFEAILKDNRIYARGAQDNKGQTFYFIKAIEELIKDKKLSVNLKILIEGEEECGSSGLDKFLDDAKKGQSSLSLEQLKCDELLVCDTGTVSLDYPAITLGCRGIGRYEFQIQGASHDLHSGVHGGLCPNPAHEIARIIALLHDEQGKIAIPKFYDGLIPPTEAELELAKKAPFTEEWYKKGTGVSPLGGEKDTPWYERAGFRPTVEINGVWSGYMGLGSKTVIPSVANAKITIRTCGGQVVNECIEKLDNFIQINLREPYRFKLIDKKGEIGALRVDPLSPPVKKAGEILKQLAKQDVLYMWFGGSIPIVKKLAEYTGSSPILVGFGLDEDRIHSPNESFSIEQLKMGYTFCSLYLSK